MQKKAVISVSEKAGVAQFAKRISACGYDILSTGGTAKALVDAGIEVIEVSDYTGFPEMLDGRVKTLHPKIEAGILARRDLTSHMETLAKHSIPLIDLVCVNLYPFEKTVADPKSSFEDAIENIDIGGPTLLRAAAKNHQGVTVIVDPIDYDIVAAELETTGEVSFETKRSLSLKAFAHTAVYDAAIHRYLCKVIAPDSAPDVITPSFKKAYDLRYGENSHQTAAFYTLDSKECCVANAKIVTEGKKLSFNNILDVNASIELVKEFQRPAAVIVKHLNPSGVGVAQDIGAAYGLAHKADSKSAFGCVVALNRSPTDELAKDIASTFVEVLAAPSFSESALVLLSVKKNMRLLAIGEMKATSDEELDMRKVVSGMLVQQRDNRALKKEDLKVVSKRAPSDEEMEAMLFAWKVCRHTKSNSIIFAKPGYTVGIGAGQMSRVDSVKIAAMKAGAHSVGAALASDAFFPFADGIEEAAKAGVTAVIHPGGSIRDDEVILAADKAGMAMVFTGVRCFLH